MARKKKTVSFKEMTKQQRAVAEKKMRSVKVTSEEVLEHDPMIFKIVKEVILRYWGQSVMHYFNGQWKYDYNAVIPRLGVSIDDLMQMGRMFVIQQIQWYKVYGDPSIGKLSTALYRGLFNKFLNYSKVSSVAKNGGRIVNVHKERKALEEFLGNLNEERSVDSNIKDLEGLIEDFSKLSRESINTNFSSNKDMKEYIYDTIAGMQLTTFQSYDEMESSVLCDQNRQMNPEESVLAKESVRRRYSSLPLSKQLDLSEANFVFMREAKKLGFTSKSKLARKLKTTIFSLNKVINGKRCNPQNRDLILNSIHKLFGKPLESILRGD